MRPVIYEINTAPFLFELSQERGEPITLATVPDVTWDNIAALHITTVWLMGVWQRSDVARQAAIGQPWLKQALPDVTDADVIGSAYSIRSYTVDERFGGDQGLAIARTKLKERGVALLLDYVPNHVAIDHEWTTSHPEYFIEGTPEQLAAKPDEFKQVGSHIYANGKDPHFPAWSDVLQLNAFSEGLRAESLSVLQKIATMCDGVRCDMAMLMMNDIFAQTWHREAPADDFWPPLIQSVKSVTPGFLFTAEAYWDREAALIEQGFDYCYDKPLYDALIKGSARDLKNRLQKTDAIEDHLLRFIENHDEPRAAQLSWPHHQAAAVIMATLPGAHLYYEGEFIGLKTHVPVQLQRRLREQNDNTVYTFYEKLLSFELQDCQPIAVRKGLFGGDDIFAWQSKDKLIVVNFGRKTAKIKLDQKVADSLLFGDAIKKGKQILLSAYGFGLFDQSAARN